MIAKIKNICRIKDDELENISGGGGFKAYTECSDAYASRKLQAQYFKDSLCPALKAQRVPRVAKVQRGGKTFSKGNLIGFCQDCHMFVYEYNLSFHENHSIICAGRR